jgi:uncharacterized protein YbjT (DUF2867 family)
VTVFLTGASGFIGSHLAEALARAGHTLVLGVHRTVPVGPNARVVAVDFTRDTDPGVWRPRLAGVDVVINAVGILRERGTQTFERLHRETPCALFDACVDANVRLVIQVSALGADAGAQSRYHMSKRAADDHLARLPLASAIVQPSLVYGRGGTSARLFDALASSPLIPVPGDGGQRVQPVHVDDVAAAIVAVVALEGGPVRPGWRIPLAGPRPLTLAAFLLRLREALGFTAGRVIPIPMPWVRLAAGVAERMPGALLDRETLAMLERGNVASVAPVTQLLGRAPRDVDDFVTRADAPAARVQALISWQLPLLKLAIAFTWIWTGIVSLGLYPIDESHALLARLAITGPLATLLLVGAAVLDLALGAAVLALRGRVRRRWMWRTQIAIVLGYMVLISIGLPEFWLHPFGPIVKNLPLLAATLLAASLEDARWTT